MIFKMTTLMNTNRLSFINSLIVLMAVSFALWASPVKAYVIEDLVNVENMNDFMLSPAKVEIFLNPGDKTTKQLQITNRLGRDLEISLEVEDFTGSKVPNEALVLLGDKKGPYSLKDYITTEINDFVLSHGQRMILPVEISVPQDAETGGLYGSLLVSGKLAKEDDQQDASGTEIVTRLGTLFFVKVGGNELESGDLKKFGTMLGDKFFQKGPISFEVLFENSGNVHLLPYGVIEITNMFGKTSSQIVIDPWFVMPDSLRAREIIWDDGSLFGRYTAHLQLNRGYGNVIDEAKVNFWVIPWKMFILAIIILILLVFGAYQLFRKFEIKRKSI
jgi:hypothetical protein